MDDADSDGAASLAFHNDPRIIVATTLATLIIAGSAYIWRSNPRKLVANSHHWLGESARRDLDSLVTIEHEYTGSESAGSSMKDKNGDNIRRSDENETKDSKIPRSKERRRRGKDPMKDIMKSVKKAKFLVKPSRAGDSEDGGPGQQANIPPKANDSSSRSRNIAQGGSSRQTNSSRSLSISSNQRSPTRSSDRRSLSPSSHPSEENDDDDDDDDDDEKTLAISSSTTPRIIDDAGTQPTSLSAPLPDSRLSDPHSPATTIDAPIHSQSVISPNNFPPYSPLGSTSPTSPSNSGERASSENPTGSPTTSNSGNTPTPAASSEMMTAYPGTPPVTTSMSLPAMNRVKPTSGSGSWEWDGTTGVSDSVSYQKPPRFRSKSRSSSSASMSPTTTSSVSLDSFSPSDPPLFVSHVSPPPTTSSDLSSIGSPVLGSPSLGKAYINGDSVGNGNTPRRVPTPRRSPTPLSGTSTPPLSLSAQTQLASLKGALEAARIREEKTKADIEKLSRDLEAMRWESSTWRRREAELQNQVHHLILQVQSYSALFSSVSGQPSPLSQHMPTNGNPNTPSNPAAAPNGYPFSPSSASPHSPPHLHIPAAQMMLSNGMLPSPSILSPMSMVHSPVPAFYPYMPHSPHPPPPPHVQQQSKQQQQPKNVFPTPFPTPTLGSSSSNNNNNQNATTTATPGSGPSSVAGSSSVGSGSPDLGGHSVNLPPGPLDRGRLRTSGVQHAGAEVWNGESGGVWEGGGGEGNESGWLVSASGEEISPSSYCDDERSYSLDNEDGIDDDDDDEEGCVSEVLADAILKRPGSIRGLSKKGKFGSKGRGEKEREVQHAEFTFPSLSDLGNVNVNRVYSAPAEESVELKDRAQVRGDGGMNGLDAEGAAGAISPVNGPESVDTLTSDVHEDMPG